MERIVVLGAPGAGKSTLTTRLAHLLGIEAFHIDELYWKTGSPPSPQEWTERERDAMRRERWIIDGNYSSTLEARLDAADTAVFLDLPTRVCLARFVRRRFQHGDAPGMAPGRRAYVTLPALRGIIAFRRGYRSWLLPRLADRDDRLTVVVLRKRREVERFVREVQAQALR